eukprot:735903_1
MASQTNKQRLEAKIEAIEQEMKRTQKNKGTEKHLGELRAKISRLRGQLQRESSMMGRRSGQKAVRVLPEGSGGADSGAFGGFVGSSRISQQQEVADSNINFCFRRLAKKDPVTKLKALEELTIIFKNKPDYELQTVAESWVNILNRLSMDNDRRVREAAHVAHRPFVACLKKVFAGHVRDCFTNWWVLQFDTSREVRRAARESFEAAFASKKKRRAAREYCRTRFLHDSGRTLAQSARQLSSMALNTPESAEERHGRVISSSLSALAAFMNKDDDLVGGNAKIAENYVISVLEVGRFWKWFHSKNSSVRRAGYTVFSAVSLRLHSVYVAGRVATLAPVCLQCLADTEPGNCAAVWEMVLLFLRSSPDAWEHVKIKKAVLPNLWRSLRTLGHGAPKAILVSLLPFLDLFPGPQMHPESSVTDATFRRFMLEVWHGRQVLSGFGRDVSDLFVQTYLECVSFICRKFSSSDNSSNSIELFLQESLFDVLSTSFTETEALPSGSMYIFGEAGKCLANLGANLPELDAFIWDAVSKICSEAVVVSKSKDVPHCTLTIRKVVTLLNSIHQHSATITDQSIVPTFSKPAVEIFTSLFDCFLETDRVTFIKSCHALARQYSVRTLLRGVDNSFTFVTERLMEVLRSWKLGEGGERRTEHVHAICSLMSLGLENGTEIVDLLKQISINSVSPTHWCCIFEELVCSQRSLIDSKEIDILVECVLNCYLRDSVSSDMAGITDFLKLSLSKLLSRDRRSIWICKLVDFLDLSPIEDRQRIRIALQVLKSVRLEDGSSELPFSSTFSNVFIRCFQLCFSAESDSVRVDARALFSHLAHPRAINADFWRGSDSPLLKICSKVREESRDTGEEFNTELWYSKVTFLLGSVPESLFQFVLSECLMGRISGIITSLGDRSEATRKLLILNRILECICHVVETVGIMSLLCGSGTATEAMRDSVDNHSLSTVRDHHPSWGPVVVVAACYELGVPEHDLLGLIKDAMLATDSDDLNDEASNSRSAAAPLNFLIPGTVISGMISAAFSLSVRSNVNISCADGPCADRLCADGSCADRSCADGSCADRSSANDACVDVSCAGPHMFPEVSGVFASSIEWVLRVADERRRLVKAGRSADTGLDLSAIFIQCESILTEEQFLRCGGLAVSRTIHSVMRAIGPNIHAHCTEDFERFSFDVIDRALGVLSNAEQFQLGLCMLDCASSLVRVVSHSSHRANVKWLQPGSMDYAFDVLAILSRNILNNDSTICQSVIASRNRFLSVILPFILSSKPNLTQHSADESQVTDTTLNTEVKDDVSPDDSLQPTQSSPDTQSVHVLEVGQVVTWVTEGLSGGHRPVGVDMWRDPRLVWSVALARTLCQKLDDDGCLADYSESLEPVFASTCAILRDTISIPESQHRQLRPNACALFDLGMALRCIPGSVSRAHSDMLPRLIEVFEFAIPELCMGMFSFASTILTTEASRINEELIAFDKESDEKIDDSVNSVGITRDDAAIVSKILPESLRNVLENISKNDSYFESDRPLVVRKTLLCWSLLLDISSVLDSRTKSSISAYLKDSLPGAMESVCTILMEHITVACSSDSRRLPWYLTSECGPAKAEFYDDPRYLLPASPVEGSRVTCLTPHLRWMRNNVDEHEWRPYLFNSLAKDLYLKTLEIFPALCRQWWSSLPQGARGEAEKLTAKQFSPILIGKELSATKNTPLPADVVDVFRLRTNVSAREITAIYSSGDIRLSLSIVLQSSHPLKPVEAKFLDAVGVKRARCSSWLLNIMKILRSENGSIREAVLLWKANVDKHFEGVEECPICYSVIHPSTRSLPRVSCRTCSGKFHPECLYKWFSTSQGSTCPLCRDLF